MSFYVVVAMTILNHFAHKGGKLLIALYAIEFGAGPQIIGVLFSLNSFCSLVFAVYAGRASDRFGSRIPLVLGSLGLGCGLLLPYFIPRLETLFFAVMMTGACYVFFQLATQQLIGALGSGHQRTHKFGIYSLGTGLTALLGPVVAGFSIDHIGHHLTFLLLGLAPIGSLLIMLMFSGSIPSGVSPVKREGHRAMDLLRNVPLRRALIAAGIIEAGGELYTFFMPIYGHALGLSASLIGIIIGTYAAASLLTRIVMPALVKRSSEETVLYISLSVAGVACALFPFATSVYLLAVISFVLGLGLGCCSPLSMITVYNRAPAGRTGEALGLRFGATKFSEVAVPVIFGTLGSAFGLSPLFWLNAMLMMSGAFIMKADAGRSGRKS
jgi:MFS family permease